MPNPKKPRVFIQGQVVGSTTLVRLVGVPRPYKSGQPDFALVLETSFRTDSLGDQCWESTDIEAAPEAIFRAFLNKLGEDFEGED